MKSEQDWRRLDSGFTRRTYRSTAVMTAFILLYLAARNWTWAVLPVFCGAALGLGLFWANEAILGRLFSQKAALEMQAARGAQKKVARSRHLGVVAGIALVKYLSVGILVWLAVRFWNIPQIAAFSAGFCLVPFNIVLRVVSRLWLARMNEV